MDMKTVPAWSRPARPQWTDPADDLVEARIETACDALGIPSPPCEVLLRIVPARGRWSVHGTWPPGPGAAVVRWMQGLGPDVLRTASKLAPRSLQAEFHRLPDAWAGFGALGVSSIRLTSTGRASLLVADVDVRIQRFVADLRRHDPTARARPRHRDVDDGMTARQREVLQFAVSLGYYDVPRQINLRELAARLDIGCGTLSELLRRAERAVIHAAADA